MNNDVHFIETLFNELRLQCHTTTQKMNFDKIELIESPDLIIVICDLTNQTENEILGQFERSREICLTSKKYFGTIFYARGVQATPKLRQKAKINSLKNQELDEHIGVVVYGINEFLRRVAKLVTSKVRFGKSKEECIQILQEMHEKKLNNKLSS